MVYGWFAPYFSVRFGTPPTPLGTSELHIASSFRGKTCEEK